MLGRRLLKPPNPYRQLPKSGMSLRAAPAHSPGASVPAMFIFPFDYIHQNAGYFGTGASDWLVDIASGRCFRDEYRVSLNRE